MVVSHKEVFVSFLDEQNIKVEGWFQLIEESSNFIKIQTGSNLLTIPFSRILKVKERLNNGSRN